MMIEGNDSIIDRFVSLDLETPPVLLERGKTDSALNVFTVNGRQARKRPGINQLGSGYYYFGRPTVGEKWLTFGGDGPHPIYEIEFFQDYRGKAGIFVLRNTLVQDSKFPDEGAMVSPAWWDVQDRRPRDILEEQGVADYHRIGRLIATRKGIFRSMPRYMPNITQEMINAERAYLHNIVAAPDPNATINWTKFKEILSSANPPLRMHVEMEDAVYHVERIWGLCHQNFQWLYTNILGSYLGNPWGRYSFTDYDEINIIDDDSHNFHEPEGASNRGLGLADNGDVMYIGSSEGLYIVWGSTDSSFGQRNIYRGDGVILGRSAINAEGIIFSPTVFLGSLDRQEKINNMIMIVGQEAKLVGDPIASYIKDLPKFMYGDYWSKIKCGMWCLRRSFDNKINGEYQEQDWLILSAKTSGWWPWKTAAAVKCNVPKAMLGTIYMGCDDGHLRYFDQNLGVDLVRFEDTEIAYPIDARWKSEPDTRPDRKFLSLESLIIKGNAGTRCNFASKLTSNPYPGPHSYVYARSDFGEWKLISKIELNPEGTRVSCIGKVDAGEVNEVEVRYPTDYYGTEVTELRRFYRDIGDSIPKAKR